MGVNSLHKTVTRQRRGCDLNTGPTVHANHSATEPPCYVVYFYLFTLFYVFILTLIGLARLSAGMGLRRLWQYLGNSRPFVEHLDTELPANQQVRISSCIVCY